MQGEAEGHPAEQAQRKASHVQAPEDRSPDVRRCLVPRLPAGAYPARLPHRGAEDRRQGPEGPEGGLQGQVRAVHSEVFLYVNHME